MNCVEEMLMFASEGLSQTLLGVCHEAFLKVLNKFSLEAQTAPKVLGEGYRSVIRVAKRYEEKLSRRKDERQTGNMPCRS